MDKKEFFEFPEQEDPILADSRERDPLLNLFDSANPDVNLFNMVDGEIANLAGSPILIYRHIPGGVDDLYDENRTKVFYQKPRRMYGHFTPRPFEENLSEFGIEITNDQTFTFNKREIENAFGVILVPGDIIKPEFSNVYFEIFEVQEDSFESYGVYHLVCSAKVLRDAEKIIPHDSYQDIIPPLYVEFLDQVLTYSDGYKVMVDVRFPGKGRPESGWPTILMLHGSGGSKEVNRGRGVYAAKYGYCSIAADVRGQGPSAELNPTVSGHQFWSHRAVADVFEYFELVEERFKIRHYSFLDFDKFGIMGRSQGGIMSFLGAAYADKYPIQSIIDAGWREATHKYPKILCISPETGSPTWAEKIVIDKKDFSGNALSNGYNDEPIPWDPDGGPSQGVHHDPAVHALVGQYFYDNNASGLYYDLMRDDPRWNSTLYPAGTFEQLKTSNTHIQAWMSYDDAWGSPDLLVSSLIEAPPGAMRAITISTGGHGSPENMMESVFQLQINRVQLFQYFMQDILADVLNYEGAYSPVTYKGPISANPSIRYAVIPDDPRWKDGEEAENILDSFFAYDPSSNFHFGTDLVDDHCELTTLYLTNDDGVLGISNIEPSSVDKIAGNSKHEILVEGYDMSSFVNESKAGAYSVNSILHGLTSSEVPSHGTVIDLSSLTFGASEDSLYTVQPSHYIGQASAVITVSANNPDFHVHVSLFDVYDWGYGVEERYINGGTYSVVGHSMKEPEEITLPFGVYAYELKEGHKLRVKIENMAIHRPPYMNRLRHGIFRIIPKWHDFEFNVYHNHPDTSPSRVILPLHNNPTEKVLDRPLVRG